MNAETEENNRQRFLKLGVLIVDFGAASLRTLLQEQYCSKNNNQRFDIEDFRQTCSDSNLILDPHMRKAFGKAISAWDVSLLYSLLVYSPYKIENEQSRHAVWNLHKKRNHYFAHVGAVQLTDTKYNIEINELQLILKDIGADMRAVKAYVDRLLPLEELEAAEKRLREELDEITANIRVRLGLWLDQFSPGRASENTGMNPPPLLDMEQYTPAGNSSTRSCSRLMSVSGRGHRPQVMGQIQLTIHPEGLTTHSMGFDTEMVFGIRGRTGSNPNNVIHPETNVIDATKCNCNRWLVGLERDEGLGAEHMRVFYNRLAPAWQVQLLVVKDQQYTMTIISGHNTKKLQVISNNDPVCIFENDVIQFGRRNSNKEYTHSVTVTHCTVCDDDKRDFNLTNTNLKINWLFLLGKSVDIQGAPVILPETRGGFSSIYKAQAKNSKELFAIKVPIRKDQEERLKQEINILLGLAGNPYVISPEYISSTAIVLKWAQYGTLEECLHVDRLSDPLDSPQKLFMRYMDIFLQVAAGIKYAHKKEVVHRDLKAANILVMRRHSNGYFDVSICDFNTSSGSSIVSSVKPVDLTGVTRSSMAPEQMEPTKKVVAPADVWNLGLLLLRLLSKNKWYPPKNSEILNLSISSESIDITHFEWIDRHLLVELMDLTLYEKDAAQRCFCLEPEKRPTAATMENAVRDIMGKRDMHLPRIEPGPDDRKKNWKKGKNLITKFLSYIERNSELTEQALRDNSDSDDDFDALFDLSQFLYRQCPVRLTEFLEIANKILPLPVTNTMQSEKKANLESQMDICNYGKTYDEVFTALDGGVFNAKKYFEALFYLNYLCVYPPPVIEHNGRFYRLEGPHINKFAETRTTVSFFSLRDAIDHIRNHGGESITMSASGRYTVRDTRVLVVSPTAEISWVLQPCEGGIGRQSFQQRLAQSLPKIFDEMRVELQTSVDELLQSAVFASNYSITRLKYDNEGKNDLHYIFEKHPEPINLFERLASLCPELLEELDEEGNTPLHTLQQRLEHHDIPQDKRDRLILDVIQRHPGALRMKNKRGDFPLHLYTNSSRCSVEILQFMMKEFPDALYKVGDFFPFQMALRHKWPLDVLKIMITNDNLRDLLDQRGKTSEKTAAHYICDGGEPDIDVLRAAIETWGVPFDIADQLSQYPLHIAAEKAPVDFLRLVVRKNPAAIKATDVWQNTPLHRALKYHNSTESCWFLFRETPAEILRLAEHDDMLPVHCYMDNSLAGHKGYRSGQLEIDTDLLKALLEYYPKTVVDGTDEYANEMKGCNVFNRHGDLPLHIAARSGLPRAVIDILLKANPQSIRIQNDDGYLPFSQPCALKNADYNEYRALKEPEGSLIKPVTMRELSTDSVQNGNENATGFVPVSSSFKRVLEQHTVKTDWWGNSPTISAPRLPPSAIEGANLGQSQIAVRAPIGADTSTWPRGYSVDGKTLAPSMPSAAVSAPVQSSLNAKAKEFEPRIKLEKYK